MGVDRLPQLAQDRARAEDWAGLLELAPRLRADGERWVHMWAPGMAVAARHLKDPRARGFLDEAVEGGFWQPELFGGQLESLFGGDPDWAGVAAAMAANVPPPELELLAWPELSPARPVVLTEIAPDRRDLLLRRLPAPAATSWGTAMDLLRWVSQRWQHSGDSHVAWKDAAHVLERVDAGERFACVEYTIVLSQALNAVGIPARRLRLCLENHHTGWGRAHQVTEAWIDDLGRWVVLDGQNGMYWTSPDGATPLDSAQLWRMCRAGEPPARVESLAGKASADKAALWWGYFHTIHPEGYQVAPPPFAPIFQDSRIMVTDQLLTAPDGLHPGLLEIGIGLAEVDGRTAVRPLTRHPHARGFTLSYDGGPMSRLDIGGAGPIPPGARTLTIATVTDYGPHAPHEIRFG